MATEMRIGEIAVVERGKSRADYPIRKYATVTSESEPGLAYIVTQRYINSGYAYLCTCKGSFLGGNQCKHLALFKEKIGGDQ